MSDEGLTRLRVRHETRYDYDQPVEVAHHTAHLRPRDTAWQQVQGWQLTIEPAPEGGPEAVQESLDPFGNWRHGFSHAQVHAQLRVVSAFEVLMQPRTSYDEAASPPWERVAQELRYHAGATLPEACEFLAGTAFAPQARALADYAAPAFTPGRPLLAAALALMHQVHDNFEYRPASTDVATSALQALSLRHGVCQDFAHVMIGALRSLGLAARYVSGYLLTQPPPGQPRLVGADASHAWVSVWCPVNGWVALDPTNDVAVGPDHVTLAWGRDYADVAPLRGVIRGGGGALPWVGVTVEGVG